jgi:malonyl-CoA/methylmalonyl-CoA synthetase
MTLLALLDQTLLRTPSRAALEVETREGALHEYTFADLESRSNRLAHELRDRGISRGDRIAFLLQNCVEIVDLWLACVKLGVIAVPINVLYQAREIAHIVSDAQPSAVITTADRQGDLPDATRFWDVDALAATAESRASVAGREFLAAPPPVGDETPLALVYTSGTTGTSKGAILTHGNFLSNARVLNEHWQITSADRMLTTLPMFHVHGLGNALHCWLLSGCHMKL